MGTSTLEMYLVGFTTAKHRLTLLLSNSTPRRIPTEMSAAFAEQHLQGLQSSTIR